jgi:hypothetical protein
MDIIPIVIILVVAIAFQIWLYCYVPVKLAQERNRNPIIWFALGFLITPYVVMFLLWRLGHKTPKVEPDQN